uniref:Uncharacterized protein n=1 Tax=Acrobeloides nanus TaxID=290746 RepID=A0A914DM61_9BILA
MEQPSTLWTKEEWINFLMKECGIIPDKASKVADQLAEEGFNTAQFSSFVEQWNTNSTAYAEILRRIGFSSMDIGPFINALQHHVSKAATEKESQQASTQAPLSRPGIPMESIEKTDPELFESLSPLLYYMPKKQPALDDNSSIKDFRSKAKSLMEGYSVDVVYIDEDHDMVLLSLMSSLQSFNRFPGGIRPPKDFDWLLGLGLSHENEDGRHITCRSGRICSLKPDDRGRIKVDVVIDGGDSGVPCFSVNDRNLIGMMVSSRTSSPRISKKYVKSETYRIECGEVKPLPETNPLPSRNAHKKRKIERGEPSYRVAETLEELVIDDDEKDKNSTESDDI